MATFGSFPVVRPLVADDARFAAGLRYVEELLRPESEARRRLFAVAVGDTGRYELGDGTYVLEQAYRTRPRSEAYFESHRRRIDIQVLVEGAEQIEIEHIDRLRVAVPYDPEQDLIKYGEAPIASRLLLRAGDAAVFFPVDGHMPTVQLDGRPVVVRKSVVKVPVAAG